MTTTTTEFATSPTDFSAPPPRLVPGHDGWFVSWHGDYTGYTGPAIPDGSARLNVYTYTATGFRIGDPILDGRIMHTAPMGTTGRVVTGKEHCQRLAWTYGYLKTATD